MAASVDDKVVGAILYSKARIETDNGSIDILTFGPLCVDPDYQKTGIGKTLLLDSMSLATEKGYKAILSAVFLNIIRSTDLRLPILSG